MQDSNSQLCGYRCTSGRNCILFFCLSKCLLENIIYTIESYTTSSHFFTFSLQYFLCLDNTSRSPEVPTESSQRTKERTGGLSFRPHTERHRSQSHDCDPPMFCSFSTARNDKNTDSTSHTNIHLSQIHIKWCHLPRIFVPLTPFWESYYL